MSVIFFLQTKLTPVLFVIEQNDIEQYDGAIFEKLYLVILY